MCNMGLNGGVSWLLCTNVASCFSYKGKVEDITHFFFLCSNFRENFDLLWSNLKTKIFKHIVTEGTPIANNIDNLDRYHKCLLLLG